MTQHVRTTYRSHRGATWALALAMAALILVVAIGSSSAATSTKPYTAVFAPATVPGGSSTTVTLTVTNNAGSQTLGSINVGAAAATGGSPTFAITSATPVSYVDSTQTFPTTVLKLRNLGIAPGTSKVFTIYADTPCTAGTYTWGIRAKQSNDFSGPPGNDFSFVAAGSDITTDVSGCLELRFVDQPAKTVVGATITDADYSAGGPVTVGLFDSGTNQQVGQCPDSVGAVSITKQQTEATDGTLAGGTATSLGGIPCAASFGSLSISGATGLPKDYTLTASATGAQSALSTSFKIIDGRTCAPNENPCVTDPFAAGDTLTQSQANGGNFVFVAMDVFSLGELPRGCLGFESVGAKLNPNPVKPIIVVDQRTSQGGELFVTYGITKSLVDKKYGKNQGQQFIPICAGAKRVTWNGSKTVPVDCDEQLAGTDQAIEGHLERTGWWGKDLDPSTGKFTGGLRQAVCDPATGFFFGIIGSFQDYTNSNPSLRIDPNTSPTVVEWWSDTAYRNFKSRWPSSSASDDYSAAFANVPWDGVKFG